MSQKNQKTTENEVKSIEYPDQNSNPIVDRLTVEYERKARVDASISTDSHNDAPPGGLEVAGLLSTIKIEVKDGENVKELVPPVVGGEGILRLAKSLEGSEDFASRKFFHGTSFSRMDVKELVQMLSIYKFVTTAEQGVSHQDARFAYFIDPNAHTLRELAEATATDFAIPLAEVKNCFGTEISDEVITEVDPTQQQNQNYPPSFYTKPKIEFVETLSLPQSVKEIWIQVASDDSINDLGSWRIEVERRQLKDVLVSLGYPQDTVEIISFKDFAKKNAESLSLQVLANNAKKASRYSNVLHQIIRNYSNTGSEDSPSQPYDINDSQFNENSLSVFVTQLSDGTRVTIDTNFKPHAYINGARVEIDAQLNELLQKDNLTTEESLLTSKWQQAMAAANKIKNFNLAEMLESGAYQLSGVGYYMAFAEIAQGKVSLYLDNYEQAIGPVSALLSTEGRLPSIAMPKGFVGTNGNFDVPTDLGAFLAFDQSSKNEINKLIGYLSTQLQTNNLSAMSGANITRDNNQNFVAEFSCIQDMYVWNELDYLYKQFGGTNQVENILYDHEYPILNTLYVYNPNALSDVLNSDRDISGFYDRFRIEQKIQALQMLRTHVLGINADIHPDFWYRISDLETALSKLNVYRRIEETSTIREENILTPSDRFKISHNKMRANLLTADSPQDELRELFDALAQVANETENISTAVKQIADLEIVKRYLQSKNIEACDLDVGHLNLILNEADGIFWAETARVKRAQIRQNVQIPAEAKNSINQQENQVTTVIALKETLDNISGFQKVFGIKPAELMNLIQTVPVGEMMDFAKYLELSDASYSIVDIQAAYPKIGKFIKISESSLPVWVKSYASRIRSLAVVGEAYKNVSDVAEPSENISQRLLNTLVMITGLSAEDIIDSKLKKNDSPLSVYIAKEREKISFDRLAAKAAYIGIDTTDMDAERIKQLIEEHIESIYKMEFEKLTHNAKACWEKLNINSIGQYKISEVQTEKTRQGNASKVQRAQIDAINQLRFSVIEIYREWWLSAVNYMRVKMESEV